MATKAELISDVILRITKGKPSDDLELEPKQVEFWIGLILPGLIAKTLNNKIKEDQAIDPSYIYEEECLNIVEVDTACDGDCQGYKFKTTLEFQPIYLTRDKGMISVETSEGEIVHKMSNDQSFMLKHLKFAKPALGNLVYRRVKKVLYLDGLDIEADEELKINVMYVPKQDIAALADSDEVVIGDDILDILSDMVEEKARRQMLESPEDLENNGNQNLDNGGAA